MFLEILRGIGIIIAVDILFTGLYVAVMILVEGCIDWRELFSKLLALVRRRGYDRDD